MPQESHDQNFKNIFLDFPKEALEWMMPQSLEKFGELRHVEFVRQEPKKRKLTDTHLSLDMPILYRFQRGRLLLWLVEFQEDKAKFSIYKLLRYTTDLMEAYPKAMVVPLVLFTDRVKWRKSVVRQLETKFDERIFLHFEYVFVKLFDLNARDYYHVRNPVLKILLPKMNYVPEERLEVIRQAYRGLFELVPALLFEKYRDFIDIYANVEAEERKAVSQELQNHKETIMIAQYIKEQGMQEGNSRLLSRMLSKKYHLGIEKVAGVLEGLGVDDLLELGEYMLDCESFDDIKQWIWQRRQDPANN